MMTSDNARAGMQQAPARSLFNALGFTPEEMKKPIKLLDDDDEEDEEGSDEE